ncbi:MAG: ATP-binding protein [Acetobacterium sp.]|nr:ATP-binding protein [Bacillota bacterium]MCG2730598.1 ATP-binding protein [Acetobacterium sp.]
MELIKIRAVNQTNMMEPIQACIKNIAGQCLLSEKEIWGLGLAVEEAMANVIKYGFDQEGQHYFDVAVEVNGTEFTVVISDRGIPGDFIENHYDEGLGISIMKHFLDRLIVKNMGFNGREQRLVKYLSGLPAYTKRLPEPAADLPGDLNLEYRPLRREDAIEVARCIYDEYELTYILEQVYYPDQFFDACERGDIYSLVAVAPGGEVAGHLAAVRLADFPGIVEMGIGVVKKKYRKYDIMRNLTDQIVAYCQAAPDINALLVEPVAYHTITQQMCDHYQLIPCGFAFHINELVNLDNKRVSVCLAIRSFKPGEKHSVYVPELLEKLLRQIYQTIGIDLVIGKKVNHPRSEKSVMTLKKDKHNGLGKLFINQTGDDIAQQLKLALLTLKKEKCPVILLYLNLTDPGINFAYQEAVLCGFFNVGCLPLSSAGDYLCMELLVEQEIDYDTIEMTPSFRLLLDELQLLDSLTAVKE